MASSLSSLIEDLPSEEATLPALTFYRGRTREGSLTYGEFSNQVGQFSGYLKDTLGIKPGERVLILSPNCLQVPVLMFALWRLGAVAVPLNPITGPDEWRFIAEHSKARGLFASREMLGRFPELTLDFKLDLTDFSQFQGAPVMRSTATGLELSIVLYTSGTTGNPKGVGLSQHNLWNNGHSMAQNFGLNRTTQFAVLPLYHAHALGVGLMSALSTRGHLIFTDQLDPFAWSEVIEKESVSFTSVVPTLLPLLLAARVQQQKVPRLQKILVSSAPLSPQIARDFETKTGISLIHGWGLSEYTNFACCIPGAISDEQRRELLFHKEGTSVGTPLPGTEVKVIPSPGSDRGELAIRGPSLMLGYYQDPEATKNTMTSDGWLKTGDEGFSREVGGHTVFFISGRIKEIIIRGGEKVSPLAVEKKILGQIPELEGKFVVLGFAHRLYGEEVGAYLELETLEDSMREKLLKALEGLPADSRPKVILFSQDPIPRTHTGKIQRRKLQPLFSKFSDCPGAVKIKSSREPSGT